MIQDYVKLAQTFLELNNKIVGIKFLNSEDDYNKADADKTITRPIHYCVAVKSAMQGHSIKFNYRNSKCYGSSKALGFIEAKENYYSGEEGVNLGLYKDKEVSSKVSNSACIKKSRTYGVLIKPLEYYKDKPDVVLIVGSSYNIMRIIQGYSYAYGISHNFSVGGNQAICIECTTTPYFTNKINISLLCSGTRHFANWKEDDLAVGIPFNKFIDTIKGVLSTANAVEPDYKKDTIKCKLDEEKIDFDLEFGKTYYKRTRNSYE